MQKVIILIIMLLFSPAAIANDFDYDFLRVVQSSSETGFGWTKMSDKEKIAYLKGYEDGYLNSLGYHFGNNEEREAIVSKLPSFYNECSIDMASFILKIDEYYGQHVAYGNTPICLAIRIIIFRELGIESEIDKNQFKFFEDMLNKITDNSAKGK